MYILRCNRDYYEMNLLVDTMNDPRGKANDRNDVPKEAQKIQKKHKRRQQHAPSRCILSEISKGG